MKKIRNINILVLGSGGREHAICEKLYQSKYKSRIFCSPGNAGIAKIAKIVKIDINEFLNISKFCKRNDIDLVIPGSEEYLEKGISDFLKLEGISVIGPSKYASSLESSKHFTKKVCDFSGIKTARWELLESARKTKNIIKKKKFPIVIKMDSLASGKGVLVAKNLREANKFLNNIINGKLGDTNSKIIIEECLFGEEASFFFAVDQTDIKFLGSAKDYKRIGEGNKGLNTGGMGCISPSPKENRKITFKIIRDIIKPTVKTMNDLGYPFRGFLYAGVIFTEKGIYLIEYNVRLGDPECQAILGRLKTDFIDICLAIKNDDLSNLKIERSKKKVACVVLASKGYPEKYSKNMEIFGINDFKENTNITVYHAGTKKDNSGKIVTNGGRVLNIIGKANTLKVSLESAYSVCKKIFWKGRLYRRDIGS